jgi:hypothetical protein
MGKASLDYEGLYVGKEFDSRHGKFKVISYEGGRYLKIEFMDGYNYSYKVRADHLKVGAVSNPYFPTVFGIGYRGIGEFQAAIHGKDTPVYVKWHSMLQRAYCPLYKEKFPTYKEVTVAEDWHNFQNFAKWVDSQEVKDIKNYDLDKDLKIVGNKEYSEAACLFVPAQINAALEKPARGVSGASGVYLRDCGYQIMIGRYGKRFNVGFHKDLDTATAMYYKAKADYLIELANLHIDRMPESTYNLVINRAELIRSKHEDCMGY